MISKYKMYSMSNEQLFLISLEKNSKGNATKQARYAQEVIWERKCDREFLIDISCQYDNYDEVYQNLIDGVIYF